MKREVNDRNILDKFTEEFCNIVNKYGRYMIVSGFSAISSGRTRGTEDIDMILEKMSLEDFTKLHNKLLNEGFECQQSENSKEIYLDYLSQGDSIRYTWKGKFLPEMEIHFPKDVIDEYQLNRRIKMPLTKLNIYFAPIEGNIAFKEEWLKSDKDIEDARHLRIVYSEKINEEEIKKIKNMIRRIRYGKK
ncbi:MAG: hypothetical protein WC511_07275 [Candidatus Pacearchaeota archaeon]